MQIKREQINPTTVKLTIIAEQAELNTVKAHVLSKLSANVKVPGFRPGKAPANIVEKNIDPTALQSEFLDHGINDLYVEAVQQQKLRPVSQPKVAVTKFVPFSTLEFTAEVETVGDIKLADYKKIKLAAKPAEVTAAEVTTVINNLRQRAATKQDVQRAAKPGDEVAIDFKGTDAKTKAPIDGADGTAYPLVLGSKSFIPGFEEELVGLKAGSEKSFVITFPKDYGATELQSREVNFDVTVTKVKELTEPKANDAFAATVGSFKTLAELKADIKKQLAAEKQQEANRTFDNELLQKIAAKSEVAIPKSLVDEEIDRIEEEEKRNTVYRGQTWQEHLDAEGLTAEEHHEKQREGAELRVKAGLILGEIAEKEQVSVTPEELEIRMQLLKGQYPDPAMQAELEKPDNRRDIQSRMLTEKALAKLRDYAAS
ncbi:trigger factor [Candidatus Saccharibacteria bacterium CG_4_10_14_0_2_um_filter_52_9]|nr:MAG: trigger factor [Candidatus Saccharibacteria bacterium CG_4_10_14_0_2_um_filter_52_9]